MRTTTFNVAPLMNIPCSGEGCQRKADVVEAESNDDGEIIEVVAAWCTDCGAESDRARDDAEDEARPMCAEEREAEDRASQADKQIDTLRDRRDNPDLYNR